MRIPAALPDARFAPPRLEARIAHSVPKKLGQRRLDGIGFVFVAAGRFLGGRLLCRKSDRHSNIERQAHARTPPKQSGQFVRCKNRNALGREEKLCYSLRSIRAFDVPECVSSGRSAAWLARLVRDQEAGGSNPLAPTISSLAFQKLCTFHSPIFPQTIV